MRKTRKVRLTSRCAHRLILRRSLRRTLIAPSSRRNILSRISRTTVRALAIENAAIMTFECPGSIAWPVMIAVANQGVAALNTIECRIACAGVDQERNYRGG